MSWKLVKDLCGEVGKSAAGLSKSVAQGVRHGAQYVANHREDIAQGTARVVREVGTITQQAGTAVSKQARALKGNSNSATRKVAAVSVDLAGKAVQALGTGTVKAASTAGHITAGTAKGAIGTAADTLDAVTISEKEIDALKKRLDAATRLTQSYAQIQRERIDEAQKLHRKQALLELVAVGGISLGAMTNQGVPQEVEAAFALAYPGLAAQGMGFMEAVQEKSASELMGLVNGVKGKLFETELVTHLNNGHLQDGLQATLATSATQPGYDLLITDPQGQVVDVLQAKATESVAYVKAALERYPDIDVTTTSEVYAQLMAAGVTGGVVDSGISIAALENKIEAADSISGDGDWVPGSASVALLALAAFMDHSVSLERRGAMFGENVSSAGLSGAAGQAVLAATGYWWLGLAAGMGSRFLAKHGGGKRERLDALRTMVDMAEKVSKRKKEHALRAGLQSLAPPKVQRQRKALPLPSKAGDASAPSVAKASPRLPPKKAPSASPPSAAPSSETTQAHGVTSSALTVRRVSVDQMANLDTVTAKDVVRGMNAAQLETLHQQPWYKILSKRPQVSAQATAKPAAFTKLPPSQAEQQKLELQQILHEALQRYPYLSTVAGKQATLELMAERNRRLRQGDSPKNALRAAIETVAPKYRPK